MTPIQPIPSLEDKEAVQVVPTWSDVQAALGESHAAHERWFAEQTPDNWSDYLTAANRAASIGADHFHATLMEAQDELAVHPII